MHPVVALLAVSLGGMIFGLGLHLWMEPWTSAVILTAGSVGGVVVSHVLGESVLYGLAVGFAIALFAIALRAFASVIETVRRPPTMASSRAWFSR